MNKENPFDQMDKHAELIGHVVVSWNEIHWFMYVLFAAFSRMPEQQARDVFFSIRNDGSQRDLTLAAGKSALSSRPHLWARLRDVMKAIGKLAGERNAAAYDVGLQFVGNPGVAGLRHSRPDVCWAAPRIAAWLSKK